MSETNTTPYSSPTPLQDAFEKTGFKITTRRRIWNWVKDNPRHTAKEIQVALKFRQLNDLYAMKKEGYLRTDKESRNGAGRHGRPLSVEVFSVAGPEYKRTKTQPKPQASPAPQTKPPEVIAAQSQLDTLFSLCLKLSVADFLNLRQRLNSVLEE